MKGTREENPCKVRVPNPPQLDPRPRTSPSPSPATPALISVRTKIFLIGVLRCPLVIYKTNNVEPPKPKASTNWKFK